MCYKCSARDRWTHQMQNSLGHDYPVRYFRNGSTLMRKDCDIEQHWYVRKSIHETNPLIPRYVLLYSFYTN